MVVASSGGGDQERCYLAGKAWEAAWMRWHLIWATEGFSTVVASGRLGKSRNQGKQG